jgi:hypothetical protein
VRSDAVWAGRLSAFEVASGPVKLASGTQVGLHAASGSGPLVLAVGEDGLILRKP